MKAEEAALQARLDSIRKAEEKVVADSLAALDSLNAHGLVMSDASRLGGLVDEGLASRYHIIIGVFREKANARKLALQAEESGFSARLIECKRGMIAVGVLGKSAGTWFAVSALIAVVASVFVSLFFAPAAYLSLKTAFDSKPAKGVYVGAKKTSTKVKKAPSSITPRR